MKRGFQCLGIRSKAAAMLSLIVLLAAAVALLWWVEANERRMKRLDDEGRAFASVTKAALVHMLESGTEDDPRFTTHMEALVSELAALGHLDWIEIFDERLRVITHSDPGRLGRPPRPEHVAHVLAAFETGEPLRIHDPDRNHLLLFLPVTLDGKPGVAPRRVVELAMNISAAQSELRGQVVGSFLLLLGILAVTAVAFFAFLDGFVLRPMARLAAAAQSPSIKPSDLEDFRARDDELGVHGRQILEALDARENRFRTIVETASDWLWELNPEGRVTFSNGGLGRILGFTDGLTDETVGEERMHPDDLEALTERLSSAVRTGDGWTGWVRRFRHRDGQYRYLESNALVVRDRSGEALGVRGADRDVTERMEIDRSLQEAEKRYRSLIEAVPHGIAKVDLTGRITFCNRASAAIHGYTREQMTGVPIWELFARETDRVAGRNAWSAMIREQPDPRRFFSNVRTGEGHEIDIQVDWSYERDEAGNLSGLIYVVTDVTEQTRAYIKLRESEERYRGLVEASPFGIYEIGLEGHLLSMNRAGSDIYRLSPRDIEGQPYLNLVLESDRERARVAFEAARRGVSQELEIRCGERMLQSTFVPVADGRGDLVMVMGISVDVTEALRSREALERSEARFKEIVREMPVLLDAFDEQGRIVMWNRECERVTGYSADEILAHPDAMDLLFPHDEERARSLREWAERGEDYRDWEWELRCKDGSTRVVAWSNVSERFPIPGWSAWGVGVDVTERRRAERALRESEETLRSIAESSPDNLLVIELDGRIRFVNRALDRETDEVPGTLVYDYVEEPFRTKLRLCFDRVLRTRRLATVSTEYDAADGKRRYFELRVAPMLEGGEVSAFVMSARDVTDRRDAAARFQAQYELLPLPTYTWRRDIGDFVFEHANEAAYAATKGKVEAMIGKRARDVYSDVPELLEGFETCFRTRKAVRKEVHYRFRTTGEVRDLETTFAFVPPDVIMIHADDITERKAAREALKRSEKRLAEAQRIARLGNWEWNVATQEVFWSRETYAIFGLDPDGFEPSYEGFLDCVHPEDREKVRAGIGDALDGRRSAAHDYRITRPDGSVRIIHGQREISADESGAPIRLVGTIQDVTEQRLAERQLTSALEEKEMLLREIHHRVKNNLQIISSLFYLQAQKCRDHAIVAMLEEMETRVNTMALIHENLYQSNHLSRVDFQSYLRSLVSGLTSAHRGLPVMIETELEEAFLSIETAVPCGLIVNELVTNAVRHAFPTREGVVTVRFSRAPDEWQLSVEDDGVGLPEEAALTGGPNLGLRLVSGLIEQIRGRLSIDRARGTRFTIRFAS